MTALTPPAGTTHVMTWTPGGGGWTLQPAAAWDGVSCTACTFPDAAGLIWPDPYFLADHATWRLGYRAAVDVGWVRFVHAGLRWPFLRVHWEPVGYVRSRDGITGPGAITRAEVAS